MSWISLRGNLGSIVGLLTGTGVMAWILVRSSHALKLFLPEAMALIFPNSVGYFAGGWLEAAIAQSRGNELLGLEMAKSTRRSLAMLSWGVCYGVGFGTGLGLAFYWCQAKSHSLTSMLTSTESEAGRS